MSKHKNEPLTRHIVTYREYHNSYNVFVERTEMVYGPVVDWLAKKAVDNPKKRYVILLIHVA